jgi:hypothetical protein
MIPLPPLPIVDGVFRCDNSSLEGIQRCPRYGWHATALKRVSAAPSIYLNFGKAVHAAFEYRYLTCGSREMTADERLEQEKVLEKAFEGVEIKDEDYLNLGRAKEVLALYNDEYPREPYEVLETEHGMEKELGEVRVQGRRVMVVWQCRIDGVVRYDGKTMARDFKTSKMIDTEREAAKWKMNGQLRGNCFCLTGEKHGKVRDFWIDHICVRPPLSRNTKNSLPRTEFHRAQHHVTDTEIEEWRNDCLREIEVWLNQCAENRPPPMRRISCAWPSKCQFFDVCSVSSGEEARMKWLESSAYKDNDFNPLAK